MSSQGTEVRQTMAAVARKAMGKRSGEKETKKRDSLRGREARKDGLVWRYLLTVPCWG